MIKLPQRPFKEIVIDYDDDFIREATRRRNYSELCWCGSTLPYKKCHRIRSSLQKANLGRVLNEQNKIFWKERSCMHPLASNSTCKGKVIDAHTIQRKGPLASIVDESNHVYHIEIDHFSRVIAVEPLGWRKASIFPGFCSYHDTELFRELETEKFIGSKKQCVLQSFRNVCCELYKKRAVVDVLKYQGGILDSGLDLHRQIEVQLSVFHSVNAQKKSIDELERLLAKFHQVILMEDWDKFEHRVYPFEGAVDLISAAVIQVDYDLNGNQFVDLFNLEEDAESIVYSVLTSECGGAVVFCWPKEFECSSKFVESFDRIDDLEKGDIFVQYCFLSSEHTFFARKWWDRLTEKQRKNIFKLHECTFYEGGKFVANESPLVDWVFCST